MNEMDKTTPKFELRGHENSILRLVFSLDSKILISGSCDKTLRIWKLKDQSLIKIIKQNDGLYGIAINQNAIGSLVLNGELKIWSTVNYKLLSKIQAHSTGAGLDISDKNPNLIISSGYDDYLVKLWNIV